jgi:hypothetical protein
MQSSQPTKKQIIVDIRQVHKANESGNTTRAYYRKNGKYESHYSKHWATFAEFLDEAGIINEKPAPSQPEVSEITGDKWSLTLPKTRIHTLQQLIEYFEVDESVWEVAKFTCLSHEMGYTTGKKTKKIGMHKELYNVRAEFKKKKDVILAKKEIADLIAQAKELIKEVPAKQTIYREQSMEGNVLEISVPDVHFGKLAHGAETGYGNYDTKIAEAVYERAIDSLIFRAKGYRYEEVLFIVGNDLLQADDEENRTTSGTVVSTDGRYHKTFRTARAAVIRAIEKLRALAPVRVIVVPGNHDNRSTWHLGESLDIYFDRYDDVVVENEPTPRKYYRFGLVGLMWCHGHQGKRTDYPLQFATEKPEIFGATKFREVHTGHTHMTKLDEQHGVRVRVLPALTETDDWHSVNGFTGNLRSAEAYVWSRTEGLVAQFFYNDDAFPPVNTKTVLDNA